MSNNDTTPLPLELINHIGEFLPLKDLLNLCIVHPGIHSLVHHPIGRKAYVDRYTVIREDAIGTKEWWYNGKRHRENGQPAVVCPDGYQEWWYNDQRHCDITGQPAIVCPNGTQIWCYNGQCHRENDQPAVVCPDGAQTWWCYNGGDYSDAGIRSIVAWSDGMFVWWYTHDIGQRSIAGLCDILQPLGSQEWWSNGKRHRENDKPAIVRSNGTQEWWFNGKRHRENGQPAFVRSNGTQEWWFNGERITITPITTGPGFDNN